MLSSDETFPLDPTALIALREQSAWLSIISLLSEVHTKGLSIVRRGAHVWGYNWIWIYDRQKATFDLLT